MDHRFDFSNFRTFEILRLCAPGHAGAYSLEGYKTVLILETPFWMAGASELMKIGGWGCDTGVKRMTPVPGIWRGRAVPCVTCRA
jgi:hypothetical protein